MKLGTKGENAAILYLEKQDYHILKTNYRGKAGEIDIIAKDIKSNCLVFIEVKTRRTTKYGTGAEAVNLTKQRKIINTALEYICTSNFKDVLCRFDVLEIYVKDDLFKYNHILNAFGDSG